MGAVCVVCGGEGTKGSYQHPYCEMCFSKCFHDNYDNYKIFMAKTHGWEYPAGYKPLNWWQRFKKRWFSDDKDKF